MSAKVTWDGLNEFRAALKDMPDGIHTDAAAIIRDTTEAAATEIRSGYPKGETGNLRSGVRTSYPKPLIGIVRSAAPHSHLYEFGTQLRQNKKGANRGAARPHPVTVPVASRKRAEMFDRLVTLVREHGFEVSGG